MLGRRKLPVLGEISSTATDERRVYSLRRADLVALSRLRTELAAERVVLVAGEAGLAGAIALAAAASAGGSRVALLECDLLRPRLASTLGLAAKPGLHEYLRWEATAAAILQPLALAGPAAAAARRPLVCIAAGEPAPRPAALLGLASFRHAIVKLRGAYDQVFVVAPALDADAGSLEPVAAQADVLLAAVPPAAGSGRAARALRARLRRLPVPARGTLLVGDPQEGPVGQRS
jgi:Mrp family chromosome partitioning ATPase